MRPEVCPVHGIVGNNYICSEETLPIKSLWEIILKLALRKLNGSRS